MAPRHDARIMRRWLDMAENLDLEGLLDLYAPEAVIESPGGRRFGRDDLEDHLPALRRIARKLRFDDATVQGDGVVTIWDGPRGALRFWNRFRAEGDHIHRHIIDLLDGITPVPAAS